jgi:hypothetical protein
MRREDGPLVVEARRDETARRVDVPSRDQGTGITRVADTSQPAGKAAADGGRSPA